MAGVRLGLAPDEYAALTMVLLRLLAFKPNAGQRVSAEKKTLNSAPLPRYTSGGMFRECANFADLYPVWPLIKPRKMLR